VLDAPFAFFQAEHTLVTQAGFDSGNTTFSGTASATNTGALADGVTPYAGTTFTSHTAADNHVVIRDMQIDSTTRANAWPVDGTMDGRTLEIEVATGDWRIYKVSAVFDLPTSTFAENTAGHIHQAIVLDQPVPTGTSFAYRLYENTLYLPRDVVEVKSARIVNDLRQWPLTILTQETAENMGVTDGPRFGVGGMPNSVFWRANFDMDSPKRAVAGFVGGFTWDGDTPAGSFRYKITYAWGARPSTGMETSDFAEPLWESEASPESELFTVTRGAQCPELLLPNIDFFLGHARSTAALLRDYGGSGVYIRVYRKRVTLADASAPLGGTEQEFDDAYYLLGQRESAAVFLDTGKLQDQSARLVDSGSYRGLALYPTPDERFVIKLRTARQPDVLVDDQDAPAVYDEAVEILVTATLMRMYEQDGNWNAVDRKKMDYEAELQLLRRRIGGRQFSGQPTRIKPARVSRRRRLTGRNQLERE
jgi:hypothetical protein